MTSQVANQSKRNFLRGRRVTQANQFRLPWINDEQSFVDGCTQCGDCISACEQQIIKKGRDGYPVVDFQIDECTFCEKCVTACPEPLFKKDLSVPAWSTHLNLKDDCLAQQNIFCQSCKDVCEPRAISFSYKNGPIPTPEINQDDCTSCGACIGPCPSDSLELILLKEAM